MRKIINISLIILFILIIFNKTETACKYVITMRQDLNVNVSIDKIKPEVNIVDINGNKLDEKNNYGIDNVKIKYSDDLSGIASAIYKHNPFEENFSECEENKLLNDVTFTQEGWYEVKITDKAGNSTMYLFYIGPAVCRIEEKYFASITSAVETIPSNLSEETEIVMLTNTTENVEIDNNRNALLNIDNYKIIGSFVIDDGAKLSTENGTINSVTERSVFEVFGTLDILNGSYESDNADIITVNGGVCNILDGNITSSTGSFVYIEEGEVNITGGTYSEYKGAKSAIINKNGVLNIKNILLSSPSRNCINSYATTNIEGGTYITGTSGHGLNVSRGNTTVKNATFIANTHGSYGAGVCSYGGNVILENCNVSNKGDTTFAISIQGGECTIINGNYTASDKCLYVAECINKNTILNIKGATFTSNETKILNAKSGIINLYSGKVSNKGIYTIVINKEGTLNANGGIIENTGGGFAIYKDTGIVTVTGTTVNGKVRY